MLGEPLSWRKRSLTDTLARTFPETRRQRSKDDTQQTQSNISTQRAWLLAKNKRLRQSGFDVSCSPKGVTLCSWTLRWELYTPFSWDTRTRAFRRCRWIRRSISDNKSRPIAQSCGTMKPPSPFNHKHCFPLLHMCDALAKIFHTSVYRPVIDLFTSSSSVQFNRASPKLGKRSPDAVM